MRFVFGLPDAPLRSGISPSVERGWEVSVQKREWARAWAGKLRIPPHFN